MLVTLLLFITICCLFDVILYDKENRLYQILITLILCIASIILYLYPIDSLMYMSLFYFIVSYLIVSISRWQDSTKGYRLIYVLQYFLLSFAITVVYIHIDAFIMLVISILTLLALNIIYYLSIYKKESNILSKYTNLQELAIINSSLVENIQRDIQMDSNTLKLYYYTSNKINAHLYSKNMRNYFIILSSEAANKLQYKEISAIILHEVAHYVKKHRFKLFVINIAFNVVILLTLNLTMLYTKSKVSITFGFCIFLIFAKILVALFTIIRNYYTHNQELSADQYTCEQGCTKELISVLDKIRANHSKSNNHISNRIRYYYTHKTPSILYRINNIKKYAIKY